MPRLPPSLFRRAWAVELHLATLLPACRDLTSARDELRWIREHVDSLPYFNHSQTNVNVNVDKKIWRTSLGNKNKLVTKLCRKRGTGYPLQYVLGSQPFGDLEIKCRPGVLIPRHDTETWVLRLAELIEWEDGNEERPDLTILDLCTGTGCIPLLLHSRLREEFPRISVAGIDIDPKAVALATENLKENKRRGLLSEDPAQNIQFERADIFSDEWISSLFPQAKRAIETRGVDILVSNPPYISAKGFNYDTQRSVRNYEPKLALVPSPTVSHSFSIPNVRPEDVFYARIFEVSQMLQPRFIVLEVGDQAQANRVIEMAQSQFGNDNVDYEIENWAERAIFIRRG
ncbi:S-adenosyl-L-methionine-dependent methyltransferase [Hypoxylon trugodes]|uniref:S-adenosyl-L-methionine-dependent methyltransferase n=1 Tax=Hypoxylon trugodes TaxID=326681 RepID=UPI00219CF8AF|nr:S-adenosyl-L-methionine-dependent methyltransferase [Hypoxylon trugodes]KAI1391441.1 S-adenosyl-L-methionine-dependent methyltransferase [Hypoxylon trugodes]